METNELTFLLKLLGCPDYRSLLSASAFNFRNKAKICRTLRSSGLIDFSVEIARVKILPPGRALLKTAADKLPITDKELKVLEKISKESGKIEPGEIKVPSLKAAELEEILKRLESRGLIEAEIGMKKTKPEVWLTSPGQEYLRDEFTDKGSQPKISGDLLTNYLRFLRKSLPAKSFSPPPDPKANGEKLIAEEILDRDDRFSDEKILQTIRDLDRELKTDNYLPIFYLRQKLEPPLSREYLDKLLYSLQRQDKIQLSTLAEVADYNAEQIKAGIPQDIGGPLFYIIVN